MELASPETETVVLLWDELHHVWETLTSRSCFHMGHILKKGH